MNLVSSEPIWKTTARLADGREIVYFDEAPGLDREHHPDRPGRPDRPDRPDRPSRASAGTRWPASGW